MARKLEAIHPGEILREEFLEPLGINPHRLALRLRVPAPRISEIVHERRGITPDTALRLGRFFKTTAEFWLNLQARYDLETTRDKEQAQIEREVQPLEAAST